VCTHLRSTRRNRCFPFAACCESIFRKTPSTALFTNQSIIRAVRIFIIIAGFLEGVQLTTGIRYKASLTDGHTTAHVIQANLCNTTYRGMLVQVLKMTSFNCKTCFISKEGKQHIIVLQISYNTSRTISSLYMFPK
jgi:hypothetical protein